MLRGGFTDDQLVSGLAGCCHDDVDSPLADQPVQPRCQAGAQIGGKRCIHGCRRLQQQIDVAAAARIVSM